MQDIMYTQVPMSSNIRNTKGIPAWFLEQKDHPGLFSLHMNPPHRPPPLFSKPSVICLSQVYHKVTTAHPFDGIAHAARGMYTNRMLSLYCFHSSFSLTGQQASTV